MQILAVILLLVVYATGVAVYATADWLADLTKRRKVTASKPVPAIPVLMERVEPVFLSEEPARPLPKAQATFADPVVEEEPLAPPDQAPAYDLSYADLYAQ